MSADRGRQHTARLDKILRLRPIDIVLEPDSRLRRRFQLFISFTGMAGSLPAFPRHSAERVRSSVRPPKTSAAAAVP